MCPLALGGYGIPLGGGPPAGPPRKAPLGAPLGAPLTMPLAPRAPLGAPPLEPPLPPLLPPGAALGPSFLAGLGLGGEAGVYDQHSGSCSTLVSS